MSHMDSAPVVIPSDNRKAAYRTSVLRAVRWLFALSLVGSVPSALAASFDCSKAASVTEKLICSDAETSALDGKLQQAYKTALTATDAPGRKALAKEQRNWIKYTRGTCQDTVCLRQIYNDRIALLARNERDIVDSEVRSYCELPNDGNHVGGECINVVPIRDSNSQVDSFNRSLTEHKQSGRIIGCSQLIDEPVENANSNESYGGYCILQDGTQRRDVTICNAGMTAKFHMQPVPLQEKSDKHLIVFTYIQCYGGY